MELSEKYPTLYACHEWQEDESGKSVYIYEIRQSRGNGKGKMYEAVLLLNRDEAEAVRDELARMLKEKK